eukprot:scaffold5509_cov111-Skeletonema_dohrnii-CCMP3373.AAC.4
MFKTSDLYCRQVVATAVCELVEFAVQLLPFNSGLVGTWTRTANFWPKFLSHINFSGDERGRAMRANLSHAQDPLTGLHPFPSNRESSSNQLKLCQKRACYFDGITGTLLHQ